MKIYEICTLNSDDVFIGYTNKSIGVTYEYYQMLYNRYKSMPLNKYYMTYGQKRSCFKVFDHGDTYFRLVKTYDNFDNLQLTEIKSFIKNRYEHKQKE
jgi:hypothetical protein